jgi:iron complex outermembrane receptor protein
MAISVRVAVLAVCIAALGQAPVVAQEAQTEPPAPDTTRRRTAGIEAITVTAEKREALLQETPIAISAFTTTDIQAFSFEQTDDIGTYTPGIQMDNSTTQHGQVAFYGRGAGSADNHSMVEQTVGMYIDGAYSGTGNAALFSLLDIERIEVLRGPQGTLFGRNTIGGAINIISRKPQPEFGAKAKVALGTYDKREFYGTVNVPLIGEKLLGRFSFARILRDDFWRNKGAGDDLDNRNRWAARSAIRWLPSEDWTVDWTFDWMDTNEHNNQWISTSDFGYNANTLVASRPLDQTIAALGITYPASDPRSRGFRVYLDNEGDEAWDDGGFQRWDVKNNAVNIAWDAAEHLQLKAITGWRRYRVGGQNDGDGSPFRLSELNFHRFHRNFLAELQAVGDWGDGRLNYTFGVNWFEQEASDDQASDVSLDVRSTASSSTLTHYDTYALGYFGQGTLGITEKLHLTAGLRYTNEKKSASYFACLNDRTRITSTAGRDVWNCIAAKPGQFANLNVGFNNGLAGPEASINVVTDAKIKSFGVPLETRFDSWTPMVRLNYDWTDELMTYLTWSKGYRSGGYSPRIALAPGTSNPYNPNRPFKEEKLFSWELGLKSQFWDNRVQFNAAGYYNQYEDQQVATFIPPATFTQNAGKSRQRGYEFEVLTQPIEGLRILLTHAWVEVDFIEFGPPSRGRTCLTGRRCAGVAPNQIPVIDSKTNGPHVPKRKYSGFVEYTFPPQAWGTLSLNGSFLREGTKAWLDTRVQNAFTKSSSYTRYDAQARLEDAFGYEGLSLALVGKNLTNRNYICCQGIDFVTFQGYGFGDPREVWVEIGYEFGGGI